MSALYRKYRPQRFQDLLGQDHLTENIKNSLKKGTVSHAYLFSGPRGTGKTTMARLLARSVNCLNLSENGEPCGKCEICQEIIENRSVDIVEIDAASNRGIDEIRELRDKVAYAPSHAKYRVYIIDEVHMLTKEAFNALLKTLEEPPRHAIFILATTELHKVPDTIISRSQRYQFHRASGAALSELLKTICKAEKLELNDEAIGLIAERSEGSFRDALTLLDNVANQEEAIDEIRLRALLGLPQKQTVKELRDNLLSGQADQLITIIKKTIDDGGDILILVKAVTDALKSEILKDGFTDKRTEIAWLLEQLLVALARTRNSADPVALLIAQLYDIASSRPGITEPEAEKAKAPIPLKIKEAEFLGEKTVKIETVSEKMPISNLADADSDEPDQSSGESLTVDSVTAPVKSHNLSEFWQLLLAGVKEGNQALYAVLRAAELEDLRDDKFIIAVRFRFYSERLYELKNKKIIEGIASKVNGRLMTLECHVKTDVKMSQEVKAEEDLLGAVVDVFEIES